VTAGELIERTLKDLGEDTSSPVYYKSSEVLDALNEAQRFFCLLTLCLETTGNLALAADTSFYHLLTTFQRFLLPLRVQVLATGAKVRPGRLGDFDSLSATWQDDVGDPTRYDVLGMDLLAVTPRPDAPGITLEITYAQTPDRMTSEGDTPEIPAEYHPCLADYGVARLRVKEGGQEFQKVLSRFGNFLTEAAKMADYVRSRMAGRGYDRQPFELAKWQSTQPAT